MIWIWSNVSGISYVKGTNINLVNKTGDNYNLVNSGAGLSSMSSSTLPENPNDEDGLLEKNYDVLAGNISDEAGLILIVNSRNQISASVLESLGFDDGVSFDDILNKEFKVAINDDYYEKIGIILRSRLI